MKQILEAIVEAGGYPLFIGGFVRDKILGIQSKDIDVEVFDLSAEQLTEVLSRFGKVDQVGVSFGVIKLTTETDDYDFTLPRRDSKVGRGHKGFIVKVDHTMTPKDAAMRRDFTINSIAMDMHGNVFDPFDGQKDLKNGVLKATSELFSDDPLRVLRGFQFAGRFNMTVDSETAEMARKMLPEASELALERIYGEVMKWALKSVKPSMGLQCLVDTGWISLFPELEVLNGLEQEPEYHPEGDVLIHTGLVCDAAVEIAIRDGLNDDERLILVLSALCHDLGKATTTIVEDGRIKSPGHDKEGEEPTISLLTRMGFGQSIIDQVVPLVKEHMVHVNGDANHRLVRRLSVRLGKANIGQLVRLIEADHSGRPPLPKKCPEVAQQMLEISKEIKVEDGKPKPIVMGRHLIDLGMQPGPTFKEILDSCYEAQLDGEFDSLEDGLKLI